jgi:hypothetical protein
MYNIESSMINAQPSHTRTKMTVAEQSLLVANKISEIQTELVKMGSDDNLWDLFPEEDSAAVYSITVPTSIAYDVGNTMIAGLDDLFLNWNQTTTGYAGIVYDIVWDYTVDILEERGDMTNVRVYLVPITSINTDDVGR